MKKTVIFLSAMVLFFTACKKDDSCPYQTPTAVVPVAQSDSIAAYLAANSLTATMDPSGMFYSILQQGTGATPDVCSTINFSYVGRFFNNQIFDQTQAGQTATYQVGQLIKGWYFGLKHLKSGGVIRMYIPPALGYGATPVYDNNNNLVVPANSYLIFDMNLINVQ